MHDFLILLEEDKSLNELLTNNNRKFKIAAQEPQNIQLPDFDIISSLCVPSYMKYDSSPEVFMFNTEDLYYYAYAFPFIQEEDQNNTRQLFSIIIASKGFRPSLFMRFLFEVSYSFIKNTAKADGFCRYGLILSFINSWSTNDNNELIIHYPFHSETVSLNGEDLQEPNNDYANMDENQQTLISLNAARSFEGFNALLLKPLTDRAWRSMITNSGVLILAKTATVASCAAISLISLITPLKYSDKSLLFTQKGDPRFFDALNNPQHPFKIVATVVSDTNDLILKQKDLMINYSDPDSSDGSNKEDLLRSLAYCNAQSFAASASFLSIIQPKSYSSGSKPSDGDTELFEPHPHSVQNVQQPIDDSLDISYQDTAEQLVEKIRASFQTVVPIPDDDPRCGCAFFTPPISQSPSFFDRTLSFLSPLKPRRGKNKNILGFGRFPTSYSFDDIRNVDTYDEKVAITEKAARIRKYYSQRLMKIYTVLYAAMNSSVLTNPFFDIFFCHIEPKIIDLDLRDEFTDKFIELIQYTETFKTWRRKQIDRTETRAAFLSIPPKEAVAKVPDDLNSIEVAENEVSSLLNRFYRDQHLTTVLKSVQIHLRKKAKKISKGDVTSQADQSIIDQMA